MPVCFRIPPFHIAQAQSTLVPLAASVYVQTLKGVPKTYKRLCIANAIIAFVYHGSQQPCRWKGGKRVGSFTGDVIDSDSDKNAEADHELWRPMSAPPAAPPAAVSYPVRNVLRFLDLTVLNACWAYTSFRHTAVRWPLLAVGSILSARRQTLTSAYIAMMFTISLHRYFHLRMCKRMLLCSTIGFIAFGSTPRDRWEQRLRYIWHTSVAGSTVFMAMVLRDDSGGTRRSMSAECAVALIRMILQPALTPLCPDTAARPALPLPAALATVLRAVSTKA